MDVAIIGAPHGIKGEVRITSLTNNPTGFSPGDVLYLEHRPHKILRSFQIRGRTWVLRLEGIRSRTQAESFRGQTLTALSEENPPTEGGFHDHQLLGFQVRTLEGDLLGTLTQVLVTGANLVYIITNNQKEILIPAIDSVVKEVNLQEQVMVVDPPPGLL